MARLQRALAFLLLVGLLAGAGVAFVRTQILKARPSPIAATDFRAARIFSPLADVPPVATVRVDVPAAGRVDVRVLDAAGKGVRTLLRDAEQPAGPLVVPWDGLRDDGRSAEPGRYRAQVRFKDSPGSETVTRVLRVGRATRGTTAHVVVKLRDAGRVEALVVDVDGVVVRRLRREERRPAGPLALDWNGDGDDGRRVPDGSYRIRLRLPDLRRTITLPNLIELDATAPTVTVELPATATVAPGLPAPDGELRARMTASEPVRVGLVVTRILPDRSAVPVYRQIRTPFSTGRALVWRGDTGTRSPGRTGPPAPAGSYIVGWEAVDRAGNVVRIPAGDVAPGRVAPAAVVRIAGVAVDVRDRGVDTAYAVATLERLAPTGSALGEPLARAEGPSAQVQLERASAPGLYLLRATAGARVGWAAEPVVGEARTLLVVPLLSWQARNPFDGDGDGFPDVPPRPVPVNRPLGAIARRGVQTLAGRLEPLGRRLGRIGATTDIALERTGVPRRARVLVLAGGGVWTPGVVAALDAFRARGGIVLLLGDPPRRRATLAGGLLTLGDAEPMPLRGAGVVRTVDGAVAALARAARAAAAASAGERARARAAALATSGAGG